MRKNICILNEGNRKKFRNKNEQIDQAYNYCRNRFSFMAQKLPRENLKKKISTAKVSSKTW